MAQCLEHKKGSIRRKEKGNPGPLHGVGDTGHKAWKDETTFGPPTQNSQETNTHPGVGPHKKESGKN